MDAEEVKNDSERLGRIAENFAGRFVKVLVEEGWEKGAGGIMGGLRPFVVVMCDTSTAMSHVLLQEKHESFVLGLDKKNETFEYYATEHLRLSGGYWGLMAMDLMGSLDKMNKEEIVSWLLRCYHPNGGFSGNINHDPHLLYTLSAIQILVIYDELKRIDVDAVARYVAGLQQADGSFIGDEWGEIDTRFSYCALNCCSLLGRLDLLDVKAATDFVARCRNFDGGFGAVPGAESHAGQIFCCLGALAIGNALHHVDSGVLGWWLCERQLPTGGLNGRPEKKQDVCYSWWVLSSLSMLSKISWIDREKLGDFILSCQDLDDGGISDRPGNIADVWHTYFGLAGLSLLGYPGFEPIDPVYALPRRTVQRLGLDARYSVV